MRLIFLGIMFCEEALKRVYLDSKHGVSMAPHVFQNNLLKGLQTLTDVEVVNIPPTGSFPFNNRRLFSKEYVWGKKNIQIGYLNLPKVKWWIQKKKITSLLNKRLKNNPNCENVTIVAYSVYEPFLNIMSSIKIKHPNVQLCLIQTDPIMGRGERDKYMTPSAISEGNRIVKKSKCIDKFVLLTKYLAESMEVGCRPFEIIECVCDSEQSMAMEGQRKNICLYTGTLNEEFGIKELVDAFKKIENAELWICGDGDTKDYICNQIKSFSNIKYYGYLNTLEIRKKQDECDFLINPRRPSGTYTMYSFPSKTAEYMMTGKPVIMYKLEGIPDEYDVFLNYLYKTNPSDIANELIHIFNDLDYDELICKAKSGRNYMKMHKSCDTQAKRLIELLEK